MKSTVMTGQVGDLMIINFYVQMGEIKCVLIVTERTECSYKLLTYDTNWKKLDYVKPHYKARYEFKKPANFSEMLKISQEISEKFDFVRVDFYDLGNRIFLYKY